MNEWLRKLLFLPPQESTIAADIDHLHYFVIIVTMLGAAFITLLGGYYLTRYRRRYGTKTGQPRALGRPLPLRVEGSIIVFILCLFVLWWFIGTRQYARLRIAPPRSLDVYVVGKQWMWLFAYPNGKSSVARLYVPANTPVRLLISSRDVIHSFFVPEFRIKQDAVPGRMTSVWFEAKRPGTYQVLCTEYCGAGHSTMRGEVVALAPDDYARWLEGDSEDFQRQDPPLAYMPPSVEGNLAPEPERVNLVQQGQLAAQRFGCVRCHTLDGSPHIGPTWLGLYMSQIPLETGGTILADDAYLTQSMMDPLARMHRGFSSVMPSYLGQMAPAEVAAILEFIRSLREPERAEVYQVPIADGGLDAQVVVPEPPIGRTESTDGGGPGQEPASVELGSRQESR